MFCRFLSSLILVVFFLGCAPKGTHRIKDITFEGNGMKSFGFDRDDALHSAMIQKKIPFLWRLRLDKEIQNMQYEELQVDGWRIEKWYAHEGYLDAKFLGWEIRTQRKWGREISTINGKIDIGEPTLLRDIAIEGDLRNNISRDLHQKVYISEGERFRLLDLDYIESSILQELQDQTFARSTVQSKVNIWPVDCMTIQTNRHECFMAEMKHFCSSDPKKSNSISTCSVPKYLKYADDEQWNKWLEEFRQEYPLQKGTYVADIVFDVQVGPSCQFGEIRIDGPVTIPLQPIYDALHIQPGDAYHISDLYQAQQRIYQLQTFSMVSLEPSLHESFSMIPIQLRLRENQFQQLRLGMGLHFENGSRQASATIDYSHMNVANHLVRLSWFNDIGYSIRSFNQSIFEQGFDLSLDKFLEQSGPVIESELEVLWPKYDMLPFSFSTSFSYQQGVEVSYKFVQPSLEIAIFDNFIRSQSNRFPLFQAKLGYHLDYFEYRDPLVPISFLTSDGSDSPSFLLSYLFQEFTLEGRNDPIAATKGSYVMLRLQQAGLGGQYDFWGSNIDLRRYISLVDVMTYKINKNGRSLRQIIKSIDKLSTESELLDILINPKSSVAWRLNGGIKSPYDFDFQSNSIPLAQYFMIGGSDTVRGWRNGYLGPYICEQGIQCVDDTGQQLSKDILPIGGSVFAIGSLEWRRYSGDYGVVVFSDIGMTWLEPSLISLQELQPSIGIGGRYKSPIGIMRVDVARRMGHSPMFQEENRYAFHFSLVEAF